MKNGLKLILVLVPIIAIGLTIFETSLSPDQKETTVRINDEARKSDSIKDIAAEENPIKVGILHSLTGTMAISEKPVVDATLLAIEEINDRGGVLGRKLLPIVMDGKSDWPTFAKNAEYLITKEKVNVIFGGWTSASRKTMLPIFEQHKSLLFYPVQYEGLEQSPNIVYTGAAPNQQVIPAVDWANKNIGNTYFLVGSDYVFPKSANEIIRYRINELGGEILGEEYRPLGDTNFKEIVDKILKTKPKVILNTINGDSNFWFFKELRSQGITPDIIPTLSFSIGENEIIQLGVDELVGDYAAWNYFQNLDNPQNAAFVSSFKKKYGEDRVVNDPMESAYTAVNIYFIALSKAGSTDIDLISKTLSGVVFSSPEGIVGVDPLTHHLYKSVRIGKILSDGQFELVSSSELPIKPIPYPGYKSKDEWNLFLNNLYEGWGKKWGSS